MKTTLRLFDQDSHLFRFSATVLSCTASPGAATVVLDATAFFPEGGGQYADSGTLGGYPVIDVQETAGIITHTVAIPSADGTLPFAVGETVEGILDVDTRLARMQNHTGEHIVSGIVHRRYGFHNVGFHLGDGDVTLDFDGVLDRDMLNEIEDEANQVVRACLPVRADYPSPSMLATMSYRAKLDLTEHVRIVEIGPPEDPVDRCACCAPHVKNTGEIGFIKLLDFMHYKGGVRIHMLCGAWALADYRRRYAATATLAAALSVKQSEVVEGFERLVADLEDRKRTVATLRGKVQAMTVASIPATDGSICYFDEGLEAVEMRRLLNELKGKCGRICGVFSGSDEDGYRFVIGRGDDSIDLKVHAKDANSALSARGGGSSDMLQGTSMASRTAIETYFRTF